MLPLFQLYSFLSNVSPLGLKGPCSQKAPAPIDEQPGPTNPRNYNLSRYRIIDENSLTNQLPPFSQRTSGFEAASVAASTK